MLENWEQEKANFRIIVPHSMQAVLDDPNKVADWTKVLEDRQTRRSLGEEYLRKGAAGVSGLAA